ncbi:MAG: hypothetical protein NTY38_17580 [Acidobacteria bacterium]|nr:hypothetical protein [Acidobacteriota bacterium]
MENHVRILGYLYTVLSALGILAGIIVLLVMGGAAGIVSGTAGDDAQVAAPIVGGIGLVISIFLVAVSLPGLAAGIGLLQWRSWARVLAIVVSGLNLLSIPIGTAIGIYGLWVLLSAETQRLFDQKAGTGRTA